MPKQQLILPGVLSLLLTSLLVITIAFSPSKKENFSPMPQLEKKIIEPSRDGSVAAIVGAKASKRLKKSQTNHLNKVLLEPLRFKLFTKSTKDHKCEETLDYELLSSPEELIILGKIIHHSPKCEQKTIAFFEMDDSTILVRGRNSADYITAEKWLNNFQ